MPGALSHDVIITFPCIFFLSEFPCQKNERLKKKTIEHVSLVISKIRPTKQGQWGTINTLLFFCYILANPGSFNLVSLPFQYVRASIHLLFSPQLRFMHFINHLMTAISAVSFNRVNQSHTSRLLGMSHGKALASWQSEKLLPIYDFQSDPLQSYLIHHNWLALFLMDRLEERHPQDQANVPRSSLDKYFLYQQSLFKMAAVRSSGFLI